MILKEIAHKVAQAFRLAQATDKKLSTGIAAKRIRKALRARTSGTGSFAGSAHITGAGWIQCSSSHICAPEIRGSIEAGAIESPDQ